MHGVIPDKNEQRVVLNMWFPVMQQGSGATF